ncbi:rhodanese-like domain-containing protein [Spiroplasma endosymbiont of Aspidapion aeneum]|uniref:rhodanese-like domain-containing protein n=1 Tax=Spiroplasma endosymbiont of Aspidapion aeneum TaxID=3066276 RepID=UPI00313D8B0B
MKSIWITAEEFIDVKNEAYIIDVRSTQEHSSLPIIPGSINIPIDELINHKIKELKDNFKSDKLIITYCNAGNRSSQACDFLRENGFSNAYVLRHGVYGFLKYIK